MKVDDSVTVITIKISLSAYFPDTPRSSTAKPASHANKCDKINLKNFLESICDKQPGTF